MGIFRQLCAEHGQYVYGQRGDLWQSVLSSFDYSHFGGAFQHDFLCHPFGGVPCVSGLLSGDRCGDTTELVVFILADSHIPHGRDRTGYRHHRLFVDHEIPRSSAVGWVRCAASDVCHAGHLSNIQYPIELEVAAACQPDDTGD